MLLLPTIGNPFGRSIINIPFYFNRKLKKDKDWVPMAHGFPAGKEF